MRFPPQLLVGVLADLRTNQQGRRQRICHSGFAQMSTEVCPIGTHTICRTISRIGPDRDIRFAKILRENGDVKTWSKDAKKFCLFSPYYMISLQI
jgi:hypothetical protein